MNSIQIALGLLLLGTATASAKDVPVAPSDYRMFNVYANRGLERQCVAITDAKDLVTRFSTLGVNKPDAVVGMIDPPVDWQHSAVLLLYQPDPPPDVVPKVRALFKDVNKEKVTLLFRYADPKEPDSTVAKTDSEAQRKAATGLVSNFAIKAYTVGTDDTRDRAKLRSPLLLVVVPKFGFLTGKSPIDCTQKL
jgi:hypothetical protein